MEIKVDFYADTFRSGVIDIPDEVEGYDEGKRRIYITEMIDKNLRESGIKPKQNSFWKCNFNLRSSDQNSINIITAKRI